MYFRHIEDESAASPATSPSPPELTRRQFLQLTSLAGSGLTLGILLPGCGSQPGAGSVAGPLTIPFLRVAPDNTVTVISKHLEAGQGVWTGLPAIVAEELDASWAQIRVESAPAEVPTYQNMAFVPMGAHAQLTGGSTAVANSWQQLREAGATARAMLVAAAAARWGVPATDITVSEGVVSHAGKGREALSVTWDESDAEKRGTTELMKEYRALGRGKEALTVKEVGEADAALAHAVKRVEGEFEFPYLAHATMEPLTAVCRLSPDKCEIWAGCQFQTGDQAAAAAAVGLKPEQVTINTLAAGGTFGRRATPDSDYISEVASIAKATGGKYPVRLIWTREDDITGGRYRPLNYHRITAGLGKDGKVAYGQRIVGQSILIGTPFESVLVKNGIDPTATGGSAAEQYDLEHARVSWTPPKVGVPVLWWRSVEHTHMAYSKEVMIDELAQAAGEDPVAFRLKLLGKHPRHAGALKLAAEKAGWHNPFPKEKGRGRGVAVHESFGSVVAQVAEVTVSGNKITVDRVVCAVDCGIAVTPDVVKAQMQSGIGYGLSAALYGKITLTDGHVDQTNFHQYQVLRINDMPRAVEVHIVPSRNHPSGVR